MRKKLLIIGQIAILVIFVGVIVFFFAFNHSCKVPTSIEGLINFFLEGCPEEAPDPWPEFAPFKMTEAEMSECEGTDSETDPVTCSPEDLASLISSHREQVDPFAFLLHEENIDALLKSKEEGCERKPFAGDPLDGLQKFRDDYFILAAPDTDSAAVWSPKPEFLEFSDFSYGKETICLLIKDAIEQSSLNEQERACLDVSLEKFRHHANSFFIEVNNKRGSSYVGIHDGINYQEIEPASKKKLEVTKPELCGDNDSIAVGVYVREKTNSEEEKSDPAIGEFNICTDKEGKRITIGSGTFQLSYEVDENFEGRWVLSAL